MLAVEPEAIHGPAPEPTDDPESVVMPTWVYVTTFGKAKEAVTAPRDVSGKLTTPGVVAVLVAAVPDVDVLMVETVIIGDMGSELGPALVMMVP